MLRRTFLKVLGAGAAVASAPQLYREAHRFVAKPKDWIEDHGDFLVVRVPDGKTFAKERLRKPVLLFMGNRTLFHDCEIAGFCNVYAGEEFAITDTFFDVSQMRLTEDRAALHLLKGSHGLLSRISVRFPAHQASDFGVCGKTRAI